MFKSWVTAICNFPDPSDLTNQFDTVEEIKFKNLRKLKLYKVIRSFIHYREVNYINQ
jgi:hypothetical protein